MTAGVESPTLAQRLEAVVSDGSTAEALKTVKGVAVPVCSLDRVRRRVGAELAAEVIASGVWPADAAARLLAAERADDESRALGHARYYAEEHLREVIADERREAPAEAQLAILRSELAEVLEQTVEADAVLGPVISADAAIEAGPDQADAWRTMTGLVARLAEVLRLHRGVVGLREGMLDTYVRNTPVRDADEGRQVLDLTGRNAVYLDVARLRSLATTEIHEVWLPSAEELQAAHDQVWARAPRPAHDGHERVVMGQSTSVGHDSHVLED